jgi:arylsulfatase A-like enzyme
MPYARVVQPLLLVILAILSGCTPGVEPPPNIVLVVLDTVRADRLVCRTDGVVPTPRIDELCARGSYFEKASSTSSWTLPAHASLFTGLYPIRHGATQEYTYLDERARTLAELLGESGYRTFGVSANPMVNIQSGLARGFDSFDETWRESAQTASLQSGEHANLLAVDALMEFRDRDRPFFLFVNFIEAHGPNAPPEPYREIASRTRIAAREVDRVKEHDAKSYYLDPASISADDFTLLSTLYNGEVAQLDALVGALVDRLEAAGAFEDSVLIVTSDHGENFGEHGHFRHIFSLHQSTVHVPLLVVLPDGAHAGERRRDPVTLVDLFATVLAAAGVAPPDLNVANPANQAARDLFEAASPPDAERPIVAEYYFPAQALGLFEPESLAAERERLGRYLRRLRSIESDGLRLIWSSDGAHELYDLAVDPDEVRNLAGDPRFATRERELHARLEAFVAESGGPRPLPGVASHVDEPRGAFEDLDPESVELLRELGYLPR